MLQKQTWKPDTSNSIVEYLYDDAFPGKPILGAPLNEQPSNVSINIVKADDHVGITDQTDKYVAIRNENQIKNIFLKDVIENLPEVVDIKTDDSGDQIKELKAGIKYEWSFDQSRKLQVALTGVPAKDKSKVDTYIDLKLVEKGQKIAGVKS